MDAPKCAPKGEWGEVFSSWSFSAPQVGKAIGAGSPQSTTMGAKKIGDYVHSNTMQALLARPPGAVIQVV